MDSHIQTFKNNSLGRPCRKHLYIVRQAKLLSDLTRRVMVAFNDKNLDACFPEAIHTFHEIEACVVILPITVVEIAGEKHEIDFFINCKLNKIIEGPACSTADFIHWCSFITLQTAQSTVEVNIGCMKKPEHETRYLEGFKLFSRSSNRPTSLLNLFATPIDLFAPIIQCVNIRQQFVRIRNFYAA